MRIDHTKTKIPSNLGKSAAIKLKADKLEEIELLNEKIKKDIQQHGIINRLDPIRTCRKCDFNAYTPEDLDFFSKNAGMKLGVGTICKECDAKKAKAYHSCNYENTGGNGGLDFTKNATLYYVKITTQEKNTFFKVGVTQETIKNLFAKNKSAKISILTKSTMVPQVAENVQRLILRDYTDYLVDDEAPILAGFTNETIFTRDIFNLTNKK